jgi:hypothetical protein
MALTVARIKGGPMMDIPIKISSRPFSIEPFTSVMLPDGIFDSAIQTLDIAFFVTNTSDLPLRFCWVRPDTHIQVEWTYVGNPFVQLGALRPGESKLVRWRAVFSNCTPGKKVIGIEFGVQVEWNELGGGFDGYQRRTVFVSKTTKDEITGIYSCEVPEGAMHLKFVRKSFSSGWDVTEQDGDITWTVSVPRIGVIHEFQASVVSRPGQEEAIPFADPWWKVVACIIAVLAAIAAIIAAKEGEGTASIGVSGDYGSEEDPNVNWCTPDPTKHPDWKNIAGCLSVLASTAARVALMDERDPFQKGRDEHPFNPIDPRRLEQLRAKIAPPAAIIAGAEMHVPIEWSYQATRHSGARDQVERSETGISDNVARKSSIDHAPNIRLYELLWVEIYLEDKSGTPFNGDAIFGHANFISPNNQVYKIPFANIHRMTHDALAPGFFQAWLSTESLAGKIGSGAVKGTWRIEIYVQNLNAAQPQMDPFEAATYVGGDFLMAPVALAQLAKVDGEDPESATSSATNCQPDKFIQTKVGN